MVRNFFIRSLSFYWIRLQNSGYVYLCYYAMFTFVYTFELKGSILPSLLPAHPTGSCQQHHETTQRPAGPQCVPVSVPPLVHDGNITALLQRHHRPP